MEEAIQAYLGKLGLWKIEVVKEFADLPSVLVEKHKILQILMNIIENAIDAVMESGNEQKKLRLRLRKEDGQGVIEVIDNGIGIKKENLTRIFGHGVTGKKFHKGFGLHGAANMAAELGGALRAHSAGPGTGATISLKFPLGKTNTLSGRT